MLPAGTCMSMHNWTTTAYTCMCVLLVLHNSTVASAHMFKSMITQSAQLLLSSLQSKFPNSRSCASIILWSGHNVNYYYLSAYDMEDSDSALNGTTTIRASIELILLHAHVPHSPHGATLTLKSGSSQCGSCSTCHWSQLSYTSGWGRGREGGREGGERMRGRGMSED